jgi:catechol 2,3-dioxygenase-like lactoylglutathione lyase family enzyme
MPRLRHIALSVKDIERAADFYCAAFGMTRSAKSEGATAHRIYLSDGVINLALLQYKSEVGSGLKDTGFAGPHHFGFVVEDLEDAGAAIKAAGGEFFFDLGKPGDDGFERKFRDPEGIIFDINTEGWPLEFPKAAE